MLKVTLLGAGNVASHLFKALRLADSVIVIQWYNRAISKLKPYSNAVEVTDNVNQLKPADLYIMAVSDNSIADLSKQLTFSNRLVAHTSGSTSIHTIDQKHKRGVLYPLQTFTKDAEIDFKSVPFCIEALDKTHLEILKTLARSVGSPYYKISTEQRQTLHLAAVFVNNFVNQLYRIAHEIGDAKQVNFDILRPLILETAKKAQKLSPYLAQTGPALRNDKNTIKKHMKQLKNKTHIAIYEQLTKSIQQTHHI